MRPAARREVAGHPQKAHDVSERRACRAAGLHRSSQRYRARPDPRVELRMRLEELAAARVRYGHRRPHTPLRREGWPVDHERIRRPHREEGLPIRPEAPERERAWRCRQGRPVAGGPNEVWAMDLMSDRLFDGRPFRVLTVMDCHTREALSIAPRASFRAFRVVEALDRLVGERGRPRCLRVDDGPGFAGRMPDRWAFLNGVGIDLSRPGTPTGDAHIEASNARLRAECLNASWFLSPGDARDRIERWRADHNDDRPRSALGGLTPSAFARQADRARKLA